MQTESEVGEDASFRLGARAKLTRYFMGAYETNWLLFALPTVFAFSIVSPKFGTYLVVVIGVISFWPRSHAGDRPARRLVFTWASALLPVLSLTIILRPNYPDTTTHTVVYVVELIVFLRVVYSSASKASAFASLVDGAGAFLVISFVLTFVGFTTQNDRTAGLDNELTGGTRIVFALSPNLAATPSAAAVFVVAVIPLLFFSGKFRHFRVVALLCALFILVAAQVRMSIVAAVVIPVLIFALPRFFRATAAWLTALLLVFPFSARIGQLNEESFLASFSRDLSAVFSARNPSGGRGDTLKSRGDIWEKALNYHSVWVDGQRQMFGFGSFGHVKSGASLSYTTQENFVGFADRHLITPHNSILMLLYDVGWVGLAVFVATVVLAAKRLATDWSPTEFSALSALVGLCLISTTESVLAPESNLTIWWLLLGVVTIAFAQDHQEAPTAFNGARMGEYGARDSSQTAVPVRFSKAVSVTQPSQCAAIDDENRSGQGAHRESPTST